jgi:exodeoxyribonuclease VII small subunit
MTTAQDLNYLKAMQRLQEIVADLEAGDIAIDDLESVIQESKDLIVFCEEKLRALDDKIEKAE